MVYTAPRLAMPGGLRAQQATSEWWVVGGLALILLAFGTIGAWCWFVCNGRVASCSIDWLHLQAIAKCYR